MGADRRTERVFQVRGFLSLHDAAAIGGEQCGHASTVQPLQRVRDTRQHLLAKHAHTIDVQDRSHTAWPRSPRRRQPPPGCGYSPTGSTTKSHGAMGSGAEN